MTMSDERLSAALKQASFCLRELLPEHPDAKMTVGIIERALSALQETATQDEQDVPPAPSNEGHAAGPALAAPSAGEPEDDPSVIGAIGAVPTPTISDAVRSIADYLATDPIEESQHSAIVLNQAAKRIDALAADLARVRGEMSNARLDGYPSKCPITQRPFFMEIEHPERGLVPTYGGPFDSYTIPEIDGVPGKPWHEYDFHMERYDHDAGGWVEGGEPVNVRLIHEEVLYALEDRAEQATAAEQAREAAEKDAGRYRGYRKVSYQNLVAHAKSFGPQMTWPSEDDFNKSHDEKIDALIGSQGK